jgi:hypothetical protein
MKGITSAGKWAAANPVNPVGSAGASDADDSGAAVNVAESSVGGAGLSTWGVRRSTFDRFRAVVTIEKCHLAQAIGQAAIQQGYRVLYRETQKLLEELADATIDGTRKEYMESLVSVPLLIIDDFGCASCPKPLPKIYLEIIMRRYERASTLLTSNRPVEDWRKLLGDAAAVSAMLDRPCITVTFLSAVLAVGEPEWTCLNRRQQGRTKPVPGTLC